MNCIAIGKSRHTIDHEQSKVLLPVRPDTTVWTPQIRVAQANGGDRTPGRQQRTASRHLTFLGSCNELEYDLLLARDLEFLPPASHARLAGQLEEVRRMLSG